MKTPIIPLLLVLMAPQNALGQETVYYLMKARTMGSGVPAGLNQEVLTKIRRTVSKHNRLVVEGEVDSMAVEGPVIPAKKLATHLEEARLAFEGLEFDKARNLADEVLATIGSLPATPAGRGLWRQAQIRLIAVADGEGAGEETTRRIDELLRIEPSLDPSVMGVEPHLVDLLIAAKARVPASVPVRLRLSPPGAKAWLNGQPIGSKPRARPGTHRLMVKRPGYAAYVGSFTAREGLPVEVQVALRRATHRHLRELDDALKELAPQDKILEIAGKATREAGSTLGLLPSLGRQDDGRVQIRIAAIQPSGKLVGVGTLLTDGLLGSKDILLALKQASSGTLEKALAVGVYRAEEAKRPERESARARERRLRQSRYRGDGLDLPVHPRLRNRQSKSNLVAAGVLLLVGGGVAAVLYHNYEPPAVSQTLAPTLGLSVEIP